MSEAPYVNITICDIPSELAKEFGKKVVRPYCPEEISQTIKDLMRKAVKKEKKE
jgi:hypothetical protein